MAQEGWQGRDEASVRFLSPQQRRLQELLRLDPSPAYRSQAVLRVEGALDGSRLERAVREIVSRHRILRPACREEPPLDLEGFDLSDLPPEEQEAAVEAALRDMGEAPFDLARGPLLRLRMAALSGSEHLLLLTLPALCADRVTLENLAREIAGAYGAAPAGEVTQYPVVAERQNELLESAELAAERESWLVQLATTGRDPRLPFERAAAGASFTPRALPIPGRVLPSAWSEVAQRHGVPLSAWLLANWAVLLWKLNGGDAVRLAHACDGRRGELREVLGLLARFLPVEVRPEPGTRFAGFAREIGSAMAEGERRQEAFWCPPVRQLADGSLEPSYFPRVFEHCRRPAIPGAGGLSFSLVRAEACCDRFDLGLWTEETADGVALELRYDAERFGREDLECLAGQLLTLLDNNAAAPLSPIGESRIQSAAERRRVLVDFNRTAWDVPADLCLHDLVAEQARLHPDRCAILCEGRQLTYGELDRRAGSVAGRLRRLGVGPDVPVAVFFERTPEALIAILAILKAGGAYVPLDPRYPPARLALMIEDCAAPVLLTEPRLVPGLPDPRGRILFLEDAVGEEPEAGAGPGNLAYMIYTSGSTGRPKGVLVTHHNAVVSTAARFRFYDGPPQAFVLLSSTAFDSAVAGIFWTLCQGGTLLLPAEELQWDMAGLAAFIERYGGSHTLCLPSLYLLLLEQAEPKQLASLRTVVVAGEACPAELAGRHRRLLPAARLYNEYGPTEATVWATAAEIGDCDAAAQVPIGRPIPNARVYLLGPDGEPAAIGLPGELYAAGPGLARGYLGQAALTAERFVPDPFGGEPGGRLYRTGDLARYRPDGTIDFLGRADDQIKIRGFRVELGEIEAALLRHPTVLQAAVVPWDGGPGGRRLAGYVVPREAGPLDDQALRAFLQQDLPDYMVPSAFVFLESLPLNANGKVDRKALPAPQARRATRYVAPRGDLERTLAAVWCEVLQVQEVGANDNFFDLGGHSLLLVQVYHRLRAAVSADLSVVDLFRYPTVGALAELLSKGEGARQEQLAEQSEERAEARKASSSRLRDVQARRRAARGF